MKDYSTYLFDLDGTLINTIDLIIDCFHFSLDYAGGVKLDDSELRSHVGLPLKKQFEIYLGHLPDVDYEDVMKRHMEYQIKHWQGKVHVYEEVKSTLQSLRTKGKKLAIVTSRRIKTASLYTEGLGIRDFFDILVTPEATENHKPHPEPALKALEQTKTSPNEAIFIGDSPFDIESGKGAGCDTAFIRPGEAPDLQMEVEPTYRLKKLSELLAIPI